MSVRGFQQNFMPDRFQIMRFRDEECVELLRAGDRSQRGRAGLLHGDSQYDRNGRTVCGEDVEGADFRFGTGIFPLPEKESVSVAVAPGDPVFLFDGG